MIYLGLDRTNGGIFIGANMLSGERAQPRPLLSPIVFANRGEDPDWQTARVAGEPTHLFFEEQYDLVSRMRRGRIYKWQQSGNRWYVSDPLRVDRGNASPGMGFRFEMHLITYQADPLEELTRRIYPKVYLGDSNHSTRWTIVAIEGSAAGGPILTLRADGYMGLLPELVQAKVPPEILPKLEFHLENVVSSAGRVDPGATVDFCRHALAVIYGHLSGKTDLDLIPGVAEFIRLRNGKEDGSTWAARIVARLHTRTKPNEVETRDLRMLEDSDARLAVELLAFVLKDLGWAA